MKSNDSGPPLTPPLVAFLSAWIGLLSLILALVLFGVSGSRDPVGELTHQQSYSMADRLLLWPVYLAPLAMALGGIALWRMRKEPRPLPPPLQAQRLQAWVGIILSGLGAVMVYVFVALRGPGGHL